MSKRLLSILFAMGLLLVLSVFSHYQRPEPVSLSRTDMSIPTLTRSEVDWKLPADGTSAVQKK